MSETLTDNMEKFYISLNSMTISVRESLYLCRSFGSGVIDPRSILNCLYNASTNLKAIKLAIESEALLGTHFGNMNFITLPLSNEKVKCICKINEMIHYILNIIDITKNEVLPRVQPNWNNLEKSSLIRNGWYQEIQEYEGIVQSFLQFMHEQVFSSDIFDTFLKQASEDMSQNSVRWRNLVLESLDTNKAIQKTDEKKEKED